MLLTIAFIAVFIIGAVAGLFGIILLGKRYTNMTWNEMSDAGILMIAAGQNRESSLVFCKDGEVINEILLKEK